MITHERARLGDLDCYLSQLFSPVPVHMILGRCATASPQIEVHHALFSCWEAFIKGLAVLQLACPKLAQALPNLPGG